MKIKFDVSVEEFLIVESVLQQYLNPACRVWVFGSRAKNQSKYNSDLDLALEAKERIDAKIIRQLKDAFEESRLPCQVDVIDLNDISASFRKIVHTQKILFPIRTSPLAPTLRFKDEQGKDYPEWEEKALENIALINMGTSPKSAAYNNDSIGLPLIQGNADVKNKLSAPRIFTSEITKECFPDDILMSVRAPVGEISKSIHHACIGRGMSAIKAKGSYIQDFIYHYLFWFEPKWRRLSQGSTFESVNTNDIKSLHIPTPSVAEQQKIAAFLSSVDTKIEQFNRKKALLSQYKKGLMQKLFSQEIRFKDEQGKDYPDWEVKKLRQIAKIYRGMGLSKSAVQSNGKIPCVLYGELFTKYHETIKVVLSLTNEETPVKSQYGDILMPTSDVTPSGLATASALLAEGVQLGGDINIIRLGKGINPIFMCYLINFYKKYFMRLVTGTTVKHIYAKDIQNIEFSIPASQKEQTKIANFLSAIDQKIELVAKQIKQAQIFKKGLLQQIFV